MRIALIAIVVLALAAVSLLYLAPPQPVIAVAPEAVFDIASLEVTNTMFTSWVVVLLLVVGGYFVGRRMSLVPSGFSGAVEAVVGGFYEFIEKIVGEANARRFFPVVATIFFYVLISNYFGLLPINIAIGKPEIGHGETQAAFEQTSVGGLDIAYINFDAETIEVEGEAGDHEGEEGAGEPFGVLAPYFRSVMTDVNAPAALAIWSFIFVEFWGLQSLGVGYLKKFFNFGKLLRGDLLGGLIDVFVGVLEFVSELSRMVSFTFRLFGNIFAGEVLLLMMTFLVPFVLVDVFYGLELFVGLVQAFVFAMLTLVFAVTAVTHHSDDHHEGEGAH